MGQRASDWPVMEKRVGQAILGLIAAVLFLCVALAVVMGPGLP